MVKLIGKVSINLDLNNPLSKKGDCSLEILDNSENVLLSLSGEETLTEDEINIVMSAEALRLILPSGEMVGHVEKVSPVAARDDHKAYVAIKALVLWEGKMGGIEGGYSSIGDFYMDYESIQVIEGVYVASGEKISYKDYCQRKDRHLLLEGNKLAHYEAKRIATEDVPYYEKDRFISKIKRYEALSDTELEEKIEAIELGEALTECLTLKVEVTDEVRKIIGERERVFYKYFNLSILGKGIYEYKYVFITAEEYSSSTFQISEECYDLLSNLWMSLKTK